MEAHILRHIDFDLRLNIVGGIVYFPDIVGIFKSDNAIYPVKKYGLGGGGYINGKGKLIEDSKKDLDFFNEVVNTNSCGGYNCIVEHRGTIEIPVTKQELLNAVEMSKIKFNSKLMKIVSDSKIDDRIFGFDQKVLDEYSFKGIDPSLREKWGLEPKDKLEYNDFI